MSGVYAMTLVTWDKSMRVGDARIDDQHKRLFDIANRFHEAYEAGRDHGELLSLLDELVSYTKTHFADEEGHMRRYQIPDAEQHHEQHQKLLKLLMNFRARLALGEGGAERNAMEFIKIWLSSHTRGADVHMGQRAGVR